MDLDQEIEKHTGADIGLIFDIEGEPGFRLRESAMLDTLTQRCGIVLATGGGAVVDPRNQTMLSANGFVVYLETTIDQQIARLYRDKRRPLLQSPDRDRILADMARLRNPIYQSIADLAVRSERASVISMARKVIHALEESDYGR